MLYIIFLILRLEEFIQRGYEDGTRKRPRGESQK